MKGPDHAMIAAATTAGAVWLLTRGSEEATFAAYASASAAAGIGALVPDIDHPKSLISSGIPSRLLALGGVAVMLVTVGDFLLGREKTPSLSSALLMPTIDAVRPYLGWAWLVIGLAVALLVASLVASIFLEHRGPTHSYVAAAAASAGATIAALIAGQSWLLGLCFLWGYVSHLLTDALTPMGLPFALWPWNEAPVPALAAAHRSPAVPMTTPVPQEVEDQAQ